MKKQNFIAPTYNKVTKTIGIPLIVMILHTFNKDYPGYLLYVVICIRIILFIKLKFETKFNTRKAI